MVEPSVKVTMPVGVPDPEVGATVAVKAIAWPKVAGLAEDVSDEVVGTGAGAMTFVRTVAESLVTLGSTWLLVAEVVLLSVDAGLGRVS